MLRVMNYKQMLYTFILLFCLQITSSSRTYMESEQLPQILSPEEQQIYSLVPQLKISNEGIFKYILIKVYIDGKLIATFVRGDKKHGYHADNFAAFAQELKAAGFTDVKRKGEKITAKKSDTKYQFVCPGGGRIQHHYQGNICSVYGYSQSFGYVDHREAQKIISKHLGYAEKDIKLNQKDY